MQHDERRADAFGKFKRVERVLDGELAVTLAVGRKFVEVWRGLVHADGQRTEIVHAGNFDLAGVHGREDARQQTDADAVAQLGAVKAEVADFVQHRAAIGVARGIPAGRERIHC